ncbi:hypothetical protein KIN20_022191 [Parelaphostrongylus tenuis]|uniref:Zinc finger PHD-type domain-containing protein n=1 Tax=Parelaphostrongylus tenuis TaxID=148309 RepID=A0AAD5N5Z8_PARTN|nr:hypothetical protein KIN20_022191 [Parelaphostrongylus tenuis]
MRRGGSTVSKWLRSEICISLVKIRLECLTEWSKLRLSCPSCRSTFGAIYSYKIVATKPILCKVQKMEPPKEAEPFEEANPLDFTMCEICSGGMDEELLLICDQCDKGFHTYCLTPPLDSVPTSEQWFLPTVPKHPVWLDRRRVVQCRLLAQPDSYRGRRWQRGFAEYWREVDIVKAFFKFAWNTIMEAAQVKKDYEEEEEEEDSESVASNESVVGRKRMCSLTNDARVLNDVGLDVPYEVSSLPSVKRIKKKRRVKKGKRRRTKNVRSRLKSKRPVKVEDPLVTMKSRRGVPREPVARLSLLGAELEPVVDSLVTENSRRFDQPLCHRKETAKDEKPIADSCDLLGSIIPEQVKTLAPGRLFAVKGDRFSSTKSFEKYKIKKTNQLSSDLKERLGIVTESEGLSNPTKVRNSSKGKYLDDAKRLSVSDEGHQSTSTSAHMRGPKILSSESKNYFQ